MSSAPPPPDLITIATQASDHDIVAGFTHTRAGILTGVEDAGVDIVATVEEAAGERRADEAAGAGDHHCLPLASTLAISSRGVEMTSSALV